jgi:hypothetical protein
LEYLTKKNSYSYFWWDKEGKTRYITLNNLHDKKQGFGIAWANIREQAGITYQEFILKNI